MIHVAFGTSNLYAKFVGTAMVSIFENAILTPPPRITVHILHDNTFSQENRDKFIYLAGQYNQQVKFYNVEKNCADEIEKLKSSISLQSLKKFSIYTTFRLLLPKIISQDVDKIIYLDADTVVNLDINEFWDIHLGDKALAALDEYIGGKHGKITSGKLICKDGIVKSENYFNVGVLLMNLKKFRQEEKKLWDAVKWAGENPQYSYWFDQDILNYFSSEDYVKIPLKFDYFVYIARRYGAKESERAIYHYAGKGNSYGMDINDVYNRLFFEYFTKTPWCTPEAFGNLSKEIEKFFDERQNLSIRLTASLSGKKRAFFTDAKTFETVKTSLLCQPDEKIILTMAADPAEELAELITESAGKELFLVFIDNYRACKDALIKKGFSEWRDFIDGKIFFSSAQGVKLNTYRFVQQM